MSYDVSIGDQSFNYTYNVSRLFYDHIPAERERGGLSEIDGLNGKQAALVLADAFERINRTRRELWSEAEVGEPKFCARYDAPNGWGSTVGGIVFLANIMAACHANPRKKVRIS